MQFAVLREKNLHQAQRGFNQLHSDWLTHPIAAFVIGHTSFWFGLVSSEPLIT